MRINVLNTAASGALLLVAGCGDSSSPRVPEPPQAPVAAAEEKAPTGGNASGTVDSNGWQVSGPNDDAKFARCAGLTFEKPAQWAWQQPSMRFRTLQYSVPGFDGSGDAELIFSVFGAGDGGPVDANIDRWVGQFSGQDGAPPRVERSQMTVQGMSVSYVELEGSYAGMGAAAPRAGWAQLGAIMQAPGRNVFIRLLGPDVTVLENKDAFDAMLQSARPDGSASGDS